MTISPVIWFEFAAYFVGILALAWYTSRTPMTHATFLLGGKRLPGWALAFSERATGESAWLLLGYTGFVFVHGLSAIWVAAGIGTGVIAAWIFLARRFMEEAERTGALTLPDYLATRAAARRNLIRWVTTLLIAAFFVFYIGAQLAGAGKILFSSFGMDSTQAIVAATAVVSATSLFGGFVSVVWTDMVQSVMMLITLVVLPVIALVHIDAQGLSLAAAVSARGTDFGSWYGGLTGLAIGVLLCNNFAWFFGYLGGQPQLSARFMALRNPREARQGMLIGVIWTLLAYGGAFVIGLAAAALYPLEAFADVETVLPVMIMDLTPVWLAGILLAGILAAIITTANSQLMVVTSSVSEDIIHRSLGLRLGERRLVLVSRVVVCAAGLVGMVIALASDSLVYLIVSWAWAGVGGTLSPAILLAFFWKRYSAAGLLATVIGGFLTTLVWINTVLDEIITSRFATFAIALACGVIFSLLLPDRQARAPGKAVS